jgi:pSer/pThr/pTyr-binding forkhead associated (FHA) protein
VVDQHKANDGADEANPATDITATFGEDYEQQLAAMHSGASFDEKQAVDALPSGSGLLVVRRGPNIGARFLLDADSTIAGRHPDADILLDDVTVSRRHAEFARMGSSFQVTDLGSLNGTYFNGQRIESSPLVDGSEVQVGKFRMTFYASPVDRANRTEG